MGLDLIEHELCFPTTAVKTGEFFCAVLVLVQVRDESNYRPVPNAVLDEAKWDADLPIFLCTRDPLLHSEAAGGTLTTDYHDVVAFLDLVHDHSIDVARDSHDEMDSALKKLTAQPG